MKYILSTNMRYILISKYECIYNIIWERTYRGAVDSVWMKAVSMYSVEGANLGSVEGGANEEGVEIRPGGLVVECLPSWKSSSLSLREDTRINDKKMGI
jgi:hypothetical protein